MKNLLSALMVCGLVAVCFSGMSWDAVAEEEIEILGTEVQVRIYNSYAITEVIKHLRNNGEDQAEHTCYFSVPDTAFVSNLSVEAGDDTFYSVAVPMDIAEAAYNYQVEIGETASILSSRGTSLYTHTISLEPGEEATVAFRFEQMIPKRFGIYSYRMIPDADANLAEFEFTGLIQYKDDVCDVTVDGLSDLTIYYEKSNRVAVNGSADSDGSLRSIYLNYTVAQPPPEGRMVFYEDSDTGYFMHIFSPNEDQVGGETIPKQIEFCLDKSGSMSGEKIERLKQAFSAILPILDPDDKFGVVTFDGEVHEPVSSSIIPATPANTLEAVEAVNDITASGSTNIGLAAETGLNQLKMEEVPNPILVILTDGQPTAGIVERQALRDHIRVQNTVDAKIFCLGFGYDVDFGLLEAIALENGGQAVRIYEGADAADQMVGFYDMISVTLLNRVSFGYSPNAGFWNPVNETVLFRGSEVIVCGIYPKGQGSLTAFVNATTQQGPATYSRTFDTDPDPDDKYVSRFWGYSRIMHLKERMTVLGESEAMINETIELAIRYNFVTDYTSYVGGDALHEALDASGYTPNPGCPQLYSDDDDDCRSDGDRISDDNSNSTPTPGLLSIILLAASIALTGRMALRRRRRP